MSTPSDRNRPPAQQPPLFEVADDRPSLAPPPNPEPTGRPRLRVANRDRIVFRAAPRGALIPQDHPARVIGDDVDGLDLKPLYDRIKAVEGGSGRAPIDPPRLVTLGLDATVEGLGSARHLDALWRARAACPGIPGDVATNSHTRADFPTAHVAWLDDLLTNTVATLMAEDLVDLNRVARDGMRVRARAGAASFRRRPTPEEAYAQAQARVDALRTEVESDPAADDRRRTKARQRADRERADRIKAALGRLPEWESQKKPEEKDQARVSTTDAEATVMKMADGGFRPASDVQFATATASRVIVGVEVVTTGSDAGPMSPMVEPIRGRYDKVPAERLVAGGFAPHDASDALSAPAVGGPGVRAGAEAQGPEGGSLDAEAERQRGRGRVARADGDGSGPGALPGAGGDGGMCQCVGARPWFGPTAGPWSEEGQGHRVVVRVGSGRDASGGAARRGRQGGLKRSEPGGNQPRWSLGSGTADPSQPGGKSGGVRDPLGSDS